VFIIQCQKAQKHSNCLKRTETSVVLIIFNGVRYPRLSSTDTVSYGPSTWLRYQKSHMLVS